MPYTSCQVRCPARRDGRHLDQLRWAALGYSPTRTGVAWLATTATSFVAAGITGGKLVAVVGVRRHGHVHFEPEESGCFAAAVQSVAAGVHAEQRGHRGHRILRLQAIDQGH